MAEHFSCCIMESISLQKTVFYSLQFFSIVYTQILVLETQ